MIIDTQPSMIEHTLDYDLHARQGRTEKMLQYMLKHRRSSIDAR